jgi:hypothetical protein
MLTRLAAPRQRPVRPASPTVLSLPLGCFRWILRQLNGRTSTGARQATASLAPPCKCIIQISGFQHPKTAYGDSAVRLYFGVLDEILTTRHEDDGSRRTRIAESAKNSKLLFLPFLLDRGTILPEWIMGQSDPDGMNSMRSSIVAHISRYTAAREIWLFSFPLVAPIRPSMTSRPSNTC